MHKQPNWQFIFAYKVQFPQQGIKVRSKYKNLRTGPTIIIEITVPKAECPLLKAFCLPAKQVLYNVVYLSLSIYVMNLFWYLAEEIEISKQIWTVNM